jgi:hypothetical protein
MASTDDKVKQALKIIKPDPERRAEFESDLVEALRLIEAGAKIDKSERTPAVRKKLFKDLATTLRRAIKLATRARYEEYTPRQTPWDSRVDNLKCFLQETGRAADYVSKFELRHGARRRKSAAIAAVWQASILLKKKTGTPPGLTHDGDWHKLARALFGNEQADLFEYMKTQHKLNQPSVG